MRNLMKTAAVAAILSLTLWGGQTQAAPITGLYNTGVNDNGTVRTDNQLELHYTLIAPSPVTGLPFVATSANGFPIPPWIGDSAESAWISASDTTFGPVGNYIYRLTFDLTGLNPVGANINGLWAVDNAGLDILINGASTGNSMVGFQAYANFAINGGFIAGINTLDFIAQDQGTPGGFRVSGIQGTAAALTQQPPSTDVPEPITLSLLGAGLLGMGMMRRRSRTAK